MLYVYCLISKVLFLFLDEPIVTHGLTLTTKIRFRDVIKIIKVAFCLQFYFLLVSREVWKFCVAIKDQNLEDNYFDLHCHYFPSMLRLKTRLCMLGVMMFPLYRRMILLKRPID